MCLSHYGMAHTQKKEKTVFPRKTSQILRVDKHFSKNVEIYNFKLLPLPQKPWNTLKYGTYSTTYILSVNDKGVIFLWTTKNEKID